MKKLLFLLLAGLPLHAQNMAQEAGPFSCPPPTSSAPIWLALISQSGSITAFYGTGTTMPTATGWKQIGKAVAPSFGTAYPLVGLAITAHNNLALATATVDNVSMTPVASNQIKDFDIGPGTKTLMGSSNLINGIWALQGGGFDIWNSSDQFNFSPWLTSGDFTFTCRVTSLSSGDPWQKVGIMLRDSCNSGAAYAYAMISFGSGVDFQYRLAANNNADISNAVAPPVAGVVAGLATGWVLSGANAAFPLRP
jgi:hypothetical protein